MSARYRKPKSRYRRPGYKNCARMVYGDASKALVIAKGVRKLLNVEVKNHDVQQTQVTITNALIITQLSNIDRGDTTNLRDGAQCKMIGIDFNYRLEVHPTDPRTTVRIMLVLDKQTNQAIYVPGDLLQDITATDVLISPRNLNNKHRFSVLYDKTHMLSLAVPAVVVRTYIKKDVLLRYDNTGNGIADLTQNSLSLCQVNNQGTNQPLITSFMRIRFVDN